MLLFSTKKERQTNAFYNQLLNNFIIIINNNPFVVEIGIFHIYFSHCDLRYIHIMRTEIGA